MENHPYPIVVMNRRPDLRGSFLVNVCGRKPADFGLELERQLPARLGERMHFIAWNASMRDFRGPILVPLFADRDRCPGGRYALRPCASRRCIPDPVRPLRADPGQHAA